MTDQQIATLKRYEELKHSTKELEEEMNSMKPDILSFLPEDVDVETAEGKFIVQRHRVWIYTPGTAELEQIVKDKKKEEEQTGTASATLGEPYITYKTKKVK